LRELSGAYWDGVSELQRSSQFPHGGPALRPQRALKPSPARTGVLAYLSVPDCMHLRCCCRELARLCDADNLSKSTRLKPITIDAHTHLLSAEALLIHHTFVDGANADTIVTFAYGPGLPLLQ